MPFLGPSDTFVQRHIGPDGAEAQEMLDTIGVESLDALMDQTIPADIRLKAPLALGPPRGERELIEELSGIAKQNEIYRSFLGMGYSDCIVPPVIQRNVLEDPNWYTAYTPYQAEISQGRLEVLLAFQTMVADLTGMPLANSSLLDEATAASEAMSMCWAIAKKKKPRFFVSEECHPQTIAVVQTRADAIGIEVEIGNHEEAELDLCFGALVQYPTTYGKVADYDPFTERARAAGVLVVVAADLLSLALLRPPAEFGADIVVGSSQRFGVPLGYGGPHAAFLATRDAYKRQMPGRIIGVSRDAGGKPALRMALQTREQHIRRDKATSNICTAQVLLAIMSALYAIYHGPDGLRRIAERVHGWTEILAAGLAERGFSVADGPYFDTLRVACPDGADKVLAAARAQRMNLRPIDANSVGIALD
jgi:glycine dehydrogenase